MVVEVALLLVQDLVLEVVVVIRTYLSTSAIPCIATPRCRNTNVRVSSFGMGWSSGGRAGSGGDDNCNPTRFRRMIDAFWQKFRSTKET